MPSVTDASSMVWNFLKTHADAAALRGMVYTGATSVLEAGDVTAPILKANEEARQTAGETTKALAISIQDAGETPVRGLDRHFEQFVVVRIYDRGRGYRNIRTARNEVMRILDPSVFEQNFDSGLYRGVLESRYIERTGHLMDLVLRVEYEGIVYAYHVVKKES